ncbi:MAG: hypothetical protein OXN88_09110 [Chloroflexota bacterium]|nr:hypothetical protein [Chloroflexota bacterium]
MDRSETYIFDELLPLFAYSFSSKGFVDLLDLSSSILPVVPDTFLVSLYDYRYLLSEFDELNKNDGRIRIWDSGGYETSTDDDLSSHSSAIAGNKPWNEDIYVATASTIPWNSRDILVSYDVYENRLRKSVVEQFEDACRLFERIPGNYLRDIVLHVDQSADVKSLVEDAKRFQGCFDVLGFTEKEIAGTWFNGIHFIDKLRNELSGKLGVYVPLHLFGCFDPKSIIRFFLAGADIFDGLSWLRYFIDNRSTLYTREYEARVPFRLQPQLGFYRPEIVANNIAELQRLRNDLAYAAMSGDYSRIQDELSFVLQVLSNGGDRS